MTENFDSYNSYLVSKHEQAEKFLGANNKERSKNSREAAEATSQPFVEVKFEKEGSVSTTLEKEIKGIDYRTEISFEYDSDCSDALIFPTPFLKTFDFNRMRRLKKLHIESNKYKFNSNEAPLPKHGIYFFDTTGLNEREMFRHVMLANHTPLMENVIVGLPPNTPLGLLSLFHELGHHWRNLDDEARGWEILRLSNKILKNEFLSARDKALILNEERSVEAVCRKDLIEILKPVTPTKDILTMSKMYLYTYSRALLEHDQRRSDKGIGK